jgi:hypothetical protein
MDKQQWCVAVWVGIGLLFLYSGFVKVRRPAEASRAAASLTRLAWLSRYRVVGISLSGAEILLGGLVLVTSVTGDAVIPRLVCDLFLLTFTVLTTAAVARKEGIVCMCFGGREALSMQSIVRTGILAGAGCAASGVDLKASTVDGSWIAPFVTGGVLMVVAATIYMVVSAQRVVAELPVRDDSALHLGRRIVQKRLAEEGV